VQIPVVLERKTTKVRSMYNQNSMASYVH